MKKCRRDMCRGSVLMECVVVLPLYLALLGGLFFLGEIAINRLRMDIGDFAVAWMSGDRCGVGVEEYGLDYLFQERFDSHGSYTSWQESADSNSDERYFNHFLALNMGCVDFTVGLPSWIRGLLFAQSAMTGTSARTDDLDEVELHKDSEQMPRAFVFVRHLDNAENFNRARTGGDKEMGWEGKTAQEMLASGILANVIGDNTISTADKLPAGEKLVEVDTQASFRLLAGYGE